MPFSFENVLVVVFYIGVIGLITFIVQVFCRWGLIGGEYSRKLIHILTSLWMATWLFDWWPRALTQLEVTWLCILLLAGILFAKQFKWFNAIFGVERATHGEASYALGVMMTALIFPDPVVYALAVVNLGLADGLAAIVGTKFGRKKYKVFGSTKSLIGMFTSFTIVLLSGIAFWVFAIDHSPSLAVVITHIVATAATVSGLEFVSFKGLDNLFIPLATGLLYNGLIV